MKKIVSFYLACEVTDCIECSPDVAICTACASGKYLDVAANTCSSTYSIGLERFKGQLTMMLK